MEVPLGKRKWHLFFHSRPRVTSSDAVMGKGQPGLSLISTPLSPALLQPSSMFEIPFSLPPFF